jgi:ABC-2 type transport system permease protein
MKLFFQQLYWELFRLFARRRTYIGFGVFLSVEILFYFLWTREKSEANMATFISRIAGGFDEYFSALTLAFLIVVFTMLLLGTNIYDKFPDFPTISQLISKSILNCLSPTLVTFEV